MADVTLSPEQLEALKVSIIEEMSTPVDRVPNRRFDDGDYTLTCHTPGCEGEGEEILFTFVGIYDAMCGACGQEITDIQPAGGAAGQ